MDHYEITIPYPERGQSFKSSITRNAFTLIEGEQSNHVEIFSDVWDFLTWLTMLKRTVNKFDAYIMNGWYSLPNVIETLRGRTDKIKSIMDFTGNGDRGDEIRNYIADFSEENDLRYGAQNYLFNGHGSLSDYWMNSTHK
ncbi:MAG: hypothetical protein KDC07_10340, partial [Chitinophagaceae bacterium]|nr:hypothetical protein [Chitinophagaceae bacterium]